jgi:hypothetical protein
MQWGKEGVGGDTVAALAFDVAAPYEELAWWRRRREGGGRGVRLGGVWHERGC